MENTGNGDKKNNYIYLDFNGKLSSDTFQNEVFLRIANLHKQNPLVQVNDTLFKGTYDQAMGTNLFFEETDDNPHTGNTFEKQTPICLKYVLSSTKLLNLQQVKIPQTKARIPNEVKHINYNLNWDYQELLQKFEDGTLQIEDISLGEMCSQNVEVEDEKTEQNDEIQSNEIPIDCETEPEREEKLENVLTDIMPVTILEAEYAQLNELARRPVRRVVSPELVAECDKKYEEAYEYHNIERQVLQPMDRFKLEGLHIDEDTLSNCIDIDRCVLYGIIPPSSDFPRVLTKEEKKKLLTMENFDNLSVAGRYYVLQSLVNDLEEYVRSVSPQKLQEKDEDGRTVIRTLEIYKKLAESVRNRLQEIKYSLECENEVKRID